MAESSIKQRIQLIGAEEIKRSFDELGRSGENAFKQIQQASDAVKFDGRFQNSVKNIQGSFVRLAENTGTLIGAFLRIGPATATAAGAFSLFVANTVKATSELVKNAKEIGTTVDQLSGFNFAAKQSGVTAAQVEGTLKNFADRLYKIQGGAAGFNDFGSKIEDAFGGAVKKFEVLTDAAGKAEVTVTRLGKVNPNTDDFSQWIDRLKVDVDGLTGKTETLTNAGLLKLRDAFAKLNQVQQRDAAAALGLTDLLPLLQKSRAELEKWLETGRQLAPSQAAQDTAKQAKEVFDALNFEAAKTRGEVDKLQNSLVVLFGDRVIQGARGFIDLLQTIDGYITRVNAYYERQAKANIPAPKMEDDAKLAASGFTVSLEALKLLKDYYETLGRIIGLSRGGESPVAKSLPQPNEVGESQKAIDALSGSVQRFNDTVKDIPKLPSFAPLSGQTGGDLGGGSASDLLAPKKSSLSPVTTTDLVPDTQAAWTQFEAQGTAAVESIRRAVVELGTTIGTSVGGAFDAVVGSAQTAASVIQQAAFQMQQALEAVIRTAADATYAASGGATVNAATGGFISGPGTSTSDSIPARLSNGEFVVRAAAVKRYGVDLLHALNGMRIGLPNLRDGIQGFAMGGLVQPVAAPAVASIQGATGRPVILNIGGESFTASASPDVAERLARYAARRVVASAGRRPSWVGA